MELLRQMVNGGWSRILTPGDAEETEFRLRYTITEIIHISDKKKGNNSHKCDREPIEKT